MMTVQRAIAGNLLADISQRSVMEQCMIITEMVNILMERGYLDYQAEVFEKTEDFGGVYHG